MFTELKEKDSAVSPIIAMMFVVVIIMLWLSMQQSTMVPKDVMSTEVEHQSQMYQSMIEIRQGILLAGSSDSSRTITMPLGAEFTNGLTPYVYPPPATGTFKTIEPPSSAKITIKNARGLGPAENYWVGGTKTFTTKMLKYEPHYREYQVASPIYFENSMVYTDYTQNKGMDQRVILAKPKIIDGKTITITTVSGEFSTTKVGEANVEVHPVSAPAQSISITGRKNEPVVLEFPTRLSEQKWETILQKEQQNGYIRNSDSAITVSDVGVPDGIKVLRLELESDITYSLRMSRVYVSAGTTNTQIPDSEAEYIAWTGSEDLTIRENSRITIQAQVRDKFNNPVSGVAVKAYAEDGDGDCIGDFQSATQTCQGQGATYYQPGRQISMGSGRVRFIYETPEVSQDRDLSIRLEIVNEDS